MFWESGDIGQGHISQILSSTTWLWQLECFECSTFAYQLILDPSAAKTEIDSRSDERFSGALQPDVMWLGPHAKAFLVQKSNQVGA